MQLVFDLEQRDVPTFTVTREHFTLEEVEQIKSWFVGASAARVGPEGHVRKDVRDAEILFISNDEQTVALYARLKKLALAHNRAHYNFELTCMNEQLMLVKYSEGGHYMWHTDNGKGYMSNRKLSLVVQLSDPGDYAGGDLEFFEGLKAPNNLGDVVVFPSYQPHRVTPVTSGERYSLVLWVSGPVFR